MSEQDIPFFTQAAILDTFIQSPNPLEDLELLAVVIEALKTKPELRRYFFQRRPHPIWAYVLWHAGFLNTPPEPEKTSQGYLLSPWDAQDYLVSVSKYVPDLVVEHIKKLEGHGYYKQRAIRALREIPADKVESVLPILLDWLNEPSSARSIAEEILTLMTSLAKQGEDQLAFALFPVLMSPRPPVDVKKHGEITFNDEATSILKLDEYHARAITEGINALQSLNLQRTVDILEELLCSSLQIEAEAGERTEYKDSSFWRTAIEDTGQDRHKEYKDVLLESLRDSLEVWAQKDPSSTSPLIERYLNDSHEILRRLGLHLLQRFPENFKDILARELTRSENYEDVGIHHEFFVLLEQGYPHLSPVEQGMVLNRVLSGPSTEQLQRIVEGDSEEEREDDARRYSRSWKLKRLWMLKAHLHGAAKETLDNLLREIGEPDHPAFTHWVGGVYSISEVSPISSEDLSRKSPEELISYLKEWHPSSEGQMNPLRESYGALAAEVAKVVWANLSKFRDRIAELAFIRSNFAGGLFSYPHDLKVDTREGWDIRLTLCERLLADEQVRNDMSQSESSGWVYFRHTVVGLFERIFTEGKADIPDEFLPRVRDILITLLSDPDPDLERDRPREGMVGHEDPITVAINHIRPQALIALINYAYYVAWREEERERKPPGSNRLEPEVEAALTGKVAFRNDNSLSLHSVYGREFVKLFKLHRQWVIDHVDDIFPNGDDTESVSFYVAAWDSYVVSNSAYSDILEFLRGKYERAIENLTKGYVSKTHLNPTEWLANHSLVEYLNSEYDIRSPEGQQSLIAQLFMKTLPDSRAQAAYALAEMCSNEKDLSSDFWLSARSLWHWRSDKAAEANHSTDFQGEMEGFSRLLSVVPDSETIVTLWPLLEGLLPYTGTGEYFETIWDSLEIYLTKEVEHDPVRVIRLYRLMHNQLKDYNRYHRGDPQKIIAIGVANEASRNETLQLIDRIKRLGGYQFDEIYKRYVR